MNFLSRVGGTCLQLTASRYILRGGAWCVEKTVEKFVGLVQKYPKTALVILFLFASWIAFQLRVNLISFGLQLLGRGLDKAGAGLGQMLQSFTGWDWAANLLRVDTLPVNAAEMQAFLDGLGHTAAVTGLVSLWGRAVKKYPSLGNLEVFALPTLTFLCALLVSGVSMWFVGLEDPSLVTLAVKWLYDGLGRTVLPLVNGLNPVRHTVVLSFTALLNSNAVTSTVMASVSSGYQWASSLVSAPLAAFSPAPELPGTCTAQSARADMPPLVQRYLKRALDTEKKHSFFGRFQHEFVPSVQRYLQVCAEDGPVLCKLLMQSYVSPESEVHCGGSFKDDPENFRTFCQAVICQFVVLRSVHLLHFTPPQTQLAYFWLKLEEGQAGEEDGPAKPDHTTHIFLRREGQDIPYTVNPQAYTLVRAAQALSAFRLDPAHPLPRGSLDRTVQVRSRSWLPWRT